MDKLSRALTIVQQVYTQAKLPSSYRRWSEDLRKMVHGRLIPMLWNLKENPEGSLRKAIVFKLYECLKTIEPTMGISFLPDFFNTAESILVKQCLLDMWHHLMQSSLPSSLECDPVVFNVVLSVIKRPEFDCIIRNPQLEHHVILAARYRRLLYTTMELVADQLCQYSTGDVEHISTKTNVVELAIPDYNFASLAPLSSPPRLDAEIASRLLKQTLPLSAESGESGPPCREYPTPRVLFTETCQDSISIDNSLASLHQATNTTTTSTETTQPTPSLVPQQIPLSEPPILDTGIPPPDVIDRIDEQRTPTNTHCGESASGSKFGSGHSSHSSDSSSSSSCSCSSSSSSSYSSSSSSSSSSDEETNTQHNQTQYATTPAILSEPSTNNTGTHQNSSSTPPVEPSAHLLREPCLDDINLPQLVVGVQAKTFMTLPISSFCSKALAVLFFRLSEVQNEICTKFSEPHADFGNVLSFTLPSSTSKRSRTLVESYPTLLGWNQFHASLPSTTTTPATLTAKKQWANMLLTSMDFFHQFLKEWLIHVQECCGTREIKWLHIPGYKYLLTAFFHHYHSIRSSNALTIDSMVIRTCHPHVFDYLIRVSFSRTPVYDSAAVAELLRLIGLWFQELVIHKKFLSKSWNYSFFCEGIEKIFETDHFFLIPQSLKLIYDYGDLFLDHSRLQLFGDLLLHKYFFTLFLHWDLRVRDAFHQVLAFKVTEERRSAIRTLKPKAGSESAVLPKISAFPTSQPYLDMMLLAKLDENLQFLQHHTTPCSSAEYYNPHLHVYVEKSLQQYHKHMQDYWLWEASGEPHPPSFESLPQPHTLNC
ncbi:hypothetical protein Pelo_5710 [Pelomyxa schiedti]|nr:hypothetical protein Pelo_5710 [Pelomyxa schiedti]